MPGTVYPLHTSPTPVLSAPYASARRINRSLTVVAEKRVLQWMALRTPRWISSDQLTALGLAAQVGAGVAYAMSRHNHHWLLLAVVCIVLNWFGDSMDGTLARVRNQQRPRYGFYVDHMVDVLGTTALMVGLGASGFVHWAVAAAMLVSFLLLSAESYLACHTIGCFQLSQGIFGPTELRLLLIAGTLALLRHPFATVFRHRLLLFDLGGTIAAIGMTGLAIAVTLRHTAQLSREEPLPR